MRRTRFIHAAGFRLDSPYTGVRNPSAAVDERLRTAPFEALRNLQALCESQAPDFLLISGGVFDLADRSVHAQLAFRDGLAAIATSGVPIYLAHGPGDPAAAWLPTIDWPKGVHVMGGRPDWFAITKDDETIALVQGASHQSSTIPGPAAADFLGAPSSEVFTIGLVSQIPLVDKDGVDSRESLPGLHYWALGPESEGAVPSDPSRRMLAVGPAQGMSAAETGAHGCYVVQTDESGRAGPSFVALDSVRRENVTLDVTDVSPEQLLTAANKAVTDALAGADGRDLVAHLILTGTTSESLVGDDQLLERLRDSVLFEHPWAWIERVEDLTDTAIPEVTGEEEYPESQSSAPDSTPLISALQDRYESVINDGALQELVGAYMPTQPDADDEEHDSENVARIARDAYALALQHLTPPGDERP
jgi:DNA repair exonuclease SbcCD nuclease subunit